MVNRVGAVLYGSQVGAHHSARGGRNQVLRLINDLLMQEPLPRSPLTDLTRCSQPGCTASAALAHLRYPISSAPRLERMLSFAQPAP